MEKALLGLKITEPFLEKLVHHPVTKFGMEPEGRVDFLLDLDHFVDAPLLFGFEPNHDRTGQINDPAFDLRHVALAGKDHVQVLQDFLLDLVGTQGLDLTGHLFAVNGAMDVIAVNVLLAVTGAAHECPIALPATDGPGQKIDSLFARIQTCPCRRRVRCEDSLNVLKGLFVDDRRPARFDGLVSLKCSKRLLVLVLVVSVDLPHSHIGGIAKQIVKSLRIPDTLHVVAAVFPIQGFRADHGLVEFGRKTAQGSKPKEHREDGPNVVGLLLIDHHTARVGRVFVVSEEKWTTVAKPAHRACVEVQRYALGRLLSLELGEVHQIEDHHLASGGRRIELFLDRQKPGAELLQVLQKETEVLDVARETRQVCHEDHVELALSDIPHHPLERGAIGVFRGITVINVGLHDLSPSSLVHIFHVNEGLKAVALVIQRAFMPEGRFICTDTNVESNFMLHHSPLGRGLFFYGHAYEKA